MSFTPAENKAFFRLVAWALKEDLGPYGDLTSKATIPANLRGRAVLVARSPGVLAGLPAADWIFALVNGALSFRAEMADGATLRPGDRLATVSGRMQPILKAERTVLNFLQRLSGVATLTRRFVDAVAGLPCRILDTRKTTPGWRALEKYAVRCGGGQNHRMGLGDGILIKDNHLAALEKTGRRGENAVIEAIRLARAKYGHDFPLEIEVDNLAQLDVALAAGPDIVLLDNMSPADLREAVRRRDATAPGVLLEASGGVTLAGVRDIAATGVDRISVGALTHSAPALDIALDYLT